MSRSLKSRLSESRRLLKNQYAYIEDLEAEEDAAHDTPPLDPRIAASRKLLEDPYAYLDDSGSYSAVGNQGREECRSSGDPA